MNNITYEIDTLMHFLSFGLTDSTPVLQEFCKLDNAVCHIDGEKKNFVFIPGTREDRVLLIAHADTVWDKEFMPYLSDRFTEKELCEAIHQPLLENGIVRQNGSDKLGLGADDRAGCAILWLLKDSGHSLLITDGEEHGQIGAHHIKDRYPSIDSELNSHRYMIQFDRRNDREFKTYKLPVSDDFVGYIEKSTGYSDAGKTARTDIVALCSAVCGVNLSVGYVNEHNPDEYLDIENWLNTYNLVKHILENEQPYFPLVNGN